MDYEKIRKAQIGMLSPTKLRMKLMGSRNSSSKGGIHSLKNEDLGYARNRLLSTTESSKDSNDLGIVHQSQTNASAESVHHRVLCSINLSTMNPTRDSDEGGSLRNTTGFDVASGFEFHHTDRTRQQSLGLFDRHAPSKWNDAEKWIINRQRTDSNVKEKLASMSQYPTKQTSPAQQMIDTSSMTVEHRPSVKQPLESGRNVKFTQDVDTVLSGWKSASDLMRRVTGEPIAVSTLQTVSMRNMGTEMTPVPTPLQSVTPNGSSICSLSSSPRRPGAAEPLSTDMNTKSTEGDSENRGGKDKLTEAQTRLNIRREIEALGIKLGKMSIASWASKEVEQFCSSPKTFDIGKAKGEYEDSATAWEEAENTKYLARCKSEHVKIQAWETHQKAKIEAKMKNAEAKAERVMACAKKKMTEKLVTTQQQVEQKKAAVKAQMNKQAEEISRRAKHIRQTGQMPSTHYLSCCGYL
ncbi:uncharacterized protein LOC122049511 [Zingiber officinale]|uniref:uncharacterized protein LOC122049511 n=1 Tax=Zingiber officinale TaxID=94328 RepID=UPI001C4CEE4C|nr:uncharacterized protein LOC122049511 [Zingiber officinale]